MIASAGSSRYSTPLDRIAPPTVPTQSITPVRVFSSIRISLACAASVGIVDCFRRTEDILPIARQAVAIGAKVLWQQIGVVNHEADALVRAHGLDSVMDRCVKIEHARLFGGLNWAGVNTGIISAKRPRYFQ